MMAKRVKDYGMAMCRSVAPAPGKVWESPNWREGYVGHIGRLKLMESEHKRPGWQFLHFYGVDYYDTWGLRTWFGKPELDGKILTFTTKNSIYTFELEGRTWKN